MIFSTVVLKDVQKTSKHLYASKSQLNSTIYRHALCYICMYYCMYRHASSYICT